MDSLRNIWADILASYRLCLLYVAVGALVIAFTPVVLAEIARVRHHV